MKQDIFSVRRKKLNAYMADQGIMAVLINSPSNLCYYTGFTGGEAFFLMPVQTADMEHTGVPEDRRSPESQGYLITDSRYYEQVERECPSLSLVRMEQKGYSENIKELFGTLGRQGILSEPADGGQPALKGGNPVIAIEDTMEVKLYLKLCRVCDGYQFKPDSLHIDKCRMVKDGEELSRIARAEQIGDMAFHHILSVIKPGVTEAEIALELEYFMKKQGASGLSFDTIVASGANSSMPHARVTDKRIAMGDFVTMDFGCIYEGYCSDMTRTVAVGTPTEEMRKVYQIVLDANLRAMEGVHAGVECKEIDALARDYIKEQGYGEYFGHGLGHGVGLLIHEEPRFSPKCEVVTESNMVITNEPGIYLPGRFGVRIEDLLVVKEGGFEVLSHSPKELIVLD